MFGTNFIQDSIENYEAGFIPDSLPGFLLPGFENYGTDMLPRDFQGFPSLTDFEGMDTANLMQMFDQVMQNMPEEMRQWLPMPFDCALPQFEGTDHESFNLSQKPIYQYPNSKIGTITVEERKLKVQKFLEKRKRRNFKKKISYMCRKKVADQRVRVKGRFVSKTQADAIQSDKITD